MAKEEKIIDPSSVVAYVHFLDGTFKKADLICFSVSNDEIDDCEFELDGVPYKYGRYWNRKQGFQKYKPESGDWHVDLNIKQFYVFTLEPCPFCGKIPTLEESHRYPDDAPDDLPVTGYHVVCKNYDCLMWGVDRWYARNPVDAVEKWNTRYKEEVTEK